jgi:uroporphyrin-3 C-methyltransferase
MTNSDPVSPSPPPVPVARPASRPAADRFTRGLAIAGLVIALIAAAVGIDAVVSARRFDASAANRLAELGQENQQSRNALTQAQASLKESQARIAELESRVADTQEQRVALEEMYRELSRSADDRVLSEVEQMLVLASQQLQLAGNVRAALTALQAADQRLARAEKLAAAPLRRAITQDMDRLKAVPQIDVAGMAVKIDQAIAQAEQLPLVIPESVPVARPTRIRASDEAGFQRAARDFWEEMKGLVRIRDLEVQDAALVSPQQGYFLRENLKLRLLAARMSLLARDEASFRDDMRASQAIVARWFDTRARPTATMLTTLKQVGESPVSITLPDINASLAAVRTARTAREKR